MKKYQRREAGFYPYFKLATWDARSFTFRDGKQSFPDETSAKEQAANLRKQGCLGPNTKCRVSKVTADDRVDLEPFNV